eukprot:365362-Chlamydomonas_euryale.AAC.6
MLCGSSGSPAPSPPPPLPLPSARVLPLTLAWTPPLALLGLPLLFGASQSTRASRIVWGSCDVSSASSTMPANSTPGEGERHDHPVTHATQIRRRLTLGVLEEGSLQANSANHSRPELGLATWRTKT